MVEGSLGTALVLLSTLCVLVSKDHQDSSPLSSFPDNSENTGEGWKAIKLFVNPRC